MLQRPVPCENLISRLPCAHDGSAPHIAHAATPKVTLRPRNPRRVTSAMKASFLSNLIGLVPEGIRDEQGVCRAEDVGRPRIEASATAPRAYALRRHATTITCRARARRLPQQSSVRVCVHIAEALVLPAGAARAARYGGRNAVPAKGQVHAARDDDSDQPAQVRAAEQPGR